MHVAINAISIQPGGGLTVLRGLVQSLHTCRPAWQITVLTGNDATHDSIVALGSANDVIRVSTGQSAMQSLLWQTARLGGMQRKRGVDVAIGFNHYQPNIACPQIVYHLNLRRFCRAYRSRRPSAVLQESLRDWLAKRAVRHADANVFESRFLRDAAALACGRRPRNPRVIYIGLPDRLLALANSPPTRDAQRSRRLVAVTSPQPHKDNATLIRTLARLARKESQQPWRLDIAGGVNPNDWKPLHRLAEDLGVRSRIKWHGFCDQDTISRLMDGALCLVSTSQLESFSMVALEAMARGCPPIVADCAAMPESVGDAGLLAFPGKPAAFAAEVLRLAMEPGLRDELISRGYTWIHKFRWSHCGAAFAESIDSLAEKRISHRVKTEHASSAA
jgi:glycosyltransferase involved in cell wall biosynthesis